MVTEVYGGWCGDYAGMRWLRSGVIRFQAKSAVGGMITVALLMCFILALLCGWDLGDCSP